MIAPWVGVRGLPRIMTRGSDIFRGAITVAEVVAEHEVEAVHDGLNSPLANRRLVQTAVEHRRQREHVESLRS